MTDKRIFRVTCSCGGALRIPEGSTVKCGYCGVFVSVLDEEDTASANGTPVQAEREYHGWTASEIMEREA